MTSMVGLAVRNFFRNTRRSLISAVSIALAITVIIFARSYINGVIKNISGNLIKLVSGHVMVTQPEYKRRERLLLLDETVRLDDQFYRGVDNNEITHVSPRIKFGVLLGKEELSVPAVGYAMTPEIEKDISGLDARLVQGQYISTGEQAMIMGRGLAERLNVKIGDTLTIITRTAYESPAGVNLLIKGIFETGIGGVDRSFFYIPLDAGQRLLDLEGMATEIAIMVKNPERAIAVAREISGHTGLLAIPHQQNSLLRYINLIHFIYGVLYLVILLVACSTIANTMLMVIFERTREIGTLKALGMVTRKVIILFITEAALIGILGSLVGVILGSALSFWLKFQGIDISVTSETGSQGIPFGPIIYFDPTPIAILSSFIFGLIATLIVAILPISRIARMEPAKALKTV